MDDTVTARKKRERIMVPIAPCETIRNRLQMGLTEFSRALGYSDGAYSDFVRDGSIVKTASLAAEALMRRQQMTGEESDVVYILRVIKGAPTTTRVDELRRLRLDDTDYLLVPARS
jgi:hypothetical protein